MVKPMLIRLLVDLDDFGRGPDTPPDRPPLLKAGTIVAADHKVAPLLVAQGRAEWIRAGSWEPYGAEVSPKPGK